MDKRQLVGCMIAHPALGLVALRHGDLSRVLPWLERAVCMEQDTGRLADAAPLLTPVMEQLMALASVDFQTRCALSLEGGAWTGRGPGGVSRSH